MEVFINEKIDWKVFELLIDTNIFNKYIILKSSHNFLDKWYFFFKQDKDSNIIMQFTKKDWTLDKPKKIILDYTDELLNNLLRERVFEENKEVRTEIIVSAIQNSLREAELPNNWKWYEEVWNDYFENNKIDEMSDSIDFDKDIEDILREIENDPELKIDEEEIEKILREIEEEAASDMALEEEIKINLEWVAKVKENFKKTNK
jgi:His-Xaa-Ser system protein HxsD